MTRTGSNVVIVGMTMLLGSTLAAWPGMSEGSAGRTEDKLPGANGTLWVTNRTNNKVAAYDASTGTLLGQVDVGSNPIGITGPPGTGKIYTSDESSNQMSVIDRDTITPITTIAFPLPGSKPHHIAHSPNGRFVYVAEFGANRVGVIETAGDTIFTEFATGPVTALTHAVSVTRDGKHLLVTNTRVNTIASLDAESGAIEWTLPIGDNPSEVVPTHDGKTALVSVRNEGRLKVVDIESRTVRESIDLGVGSMPDTIYLTPDGKSAVIGLRETPSRAAVVDLTTLGVQSAPLPGTTTGHNTISANGEYSFIAVEGASGVAVFLTETQQYLTLYPFPGGGRPHGIFYDPRHQD